MVHLKEHVSEIALYVCFGVTIGYFFSTMYGLNNRNAFFTSIRGRLLLIESSRQYEMDKMLNCSTDKELFYNALIDVGFEVQSIKTNKNVFVATVNVNEEGLEKIQQILDATIVRKENCIEIHWNSQHLQKEQRTNPSKHILDGICFFSSNDWQVWIDGKMHDQNTKTLSDGGFIEQVTENTVILNVRGEKIKLMAE